MVGEFDLLGNPQLSSACIFLWILNRRDHCLTSFSEQTEGGRGETVLHNNRYLWLRLTLILPISGLMSSLRPSWASPGYGHVARAPGFDSHCLYPAQNAFLSLKDSLL